MEPPIYNTIEISYCFRLNELAFRHAYVRTCVQIVWSVSFYDRTANTERKLFIDRYCIWQKADLTECSVGSLGNTGVGVGLWN